MIESVVKLSKALDVTKYGGKAVNLAKMISAGVPVPEGFAISLSAFDNQGLLSVFAKDILSNLISSNTLYAVRSSALAEDADDASWAGQFESFLNVESNELFQMIEECHASTKERAKAYALNQQNKSEFKIAVVVQEMINPKYAGVLFTKDPVTGQDKFVTEYVEGLGETLVSGLADPKRITWKVGDEVTAPFDLSQLTKLAQKVEKLFGSPQDIEWAWAENTMWFVQARPITAKQTQSEGFYLGEPDELFYWGPSRAKPMYMSDFMFAVELFFIKLSQDVIMPDPPPTLVLFHDNKMVWLNNAQEFAKFTESMFEQYVHRDMIDNDYKKWLNLVDILDHKKADAPDLVEAWGYTLFAEFSLYGAETAIAKMLHRFNAKQKQQIWGTFTYPEKPTFISKIDNELYQCKDINAMAQKYPWIEDGYSGTYSTPREYFEKRLKIVLDNPPLQAPLPDKNKIIKDMMLSDSEVHALNLARKLAEFIDERKLWMMRTRRYIKTSAGKIVNGWSFKDKTTSLISENQVAELWERYVDFKASTKELIGIVASNGGREFVNGEVRVLDAPTDNVEDDMILVVPSTSPSYVPLMRKARALITDHGGMMSHAAIVGREFNLPCIVGTKQATKVLKDGDKVVLDLVKGEVNK